MSTIQTPSNIEGRGRKIERVMDVAQAKREIEAQRNFYSALNKALELIERGNLFLGKTHLIQACHRAGMLTMVMQDQMNTMLMVLSNAHHDVLADRLKEQAPRILTWDARVEEAARAYQATLGEEIPF